MRRLTAWNLTAAMLLAGMWLVFSSGNAHADDSGVYVEGYTWDYSGRPPLVPTWHVVSQEEIFRRCDGSHNFRPFACAHYDVGHGRCDVYAELPERDEPEFIRWHEFLHCAGWDHREGPR